MKGFAYIKYPLEFAFDARTSRGPVKTHVAWLIRAADSQKPGKYGWGEASPLKGLSIDATEDFEAKLKDIIDGLNHGKDIHEYDLELFPSIRFGLETAILDLENGGNRLLYDTPFLDGNPIDINGLIWMADSITMLNETNKKIRAGFTCIKFKLGALDFDEECRMIEQVRKKFSAFKIEIRLDANGAFKTDEAIQKLKELERFNIHSIEQPIAAGQHEIMHELCRKSKIKIALDEELTGVDVMRQGEELISKIKPAFLVLKPTLLGGLKMADEWIKIAGKHHIDWWATSALESNIGLNAIAQWCSGHHLSLPQGLGTGNLYNNNIASPLYVENGKLFYAKNKKWVLPEIDLFINS